MSQSLSLMDLHPVAPVFDGHTKLKRDIQNQDKVLCVCSTGRLYHVGSDYAKKMFSEAIEQDLLFLHAKRENENDTIYVPTHPTPRLKKVLKTTIDSVQGEVSRAYSILKDVNRYYEIGKRLDSQKPIPEFHDRLIGAFQKLCRMSILPLTTRKPVFNHQSMTLLMEECFPSHHHLVSFLKDPAILGAGKESTKFGA